MRLASHRNANNRCATVFPTKSEQGPATTSDSVVAFPIVREETDLHAPLPLADGGCWVISACHARCCSPLAELPPQCPLRCCALTALAQQTTRAPYPQPASKHMPAAFSLLSTQASQVHRAVANTPLDTALPLHLQSQSTTPAAKIRVVSLQA